MRGMAITDPLQRSCALRAPRAFGEAPTTLAPAIHCTGRRPDAAGGWARAYEGGTSAWRKGCCGYCVPVGSPWADGILDWNASTAPPASAALPSRPLALRLRVETCREMAASAARPAPGASPSWVGHGAGAASITAESPTRKGHPARRRLRAAGRAQPRAGGWGSKSGERD